MLMLVYKGLYIVRARSTLAYARNILRASHGRVTGEPRARHERVTRESRADFESYVEICWPRCV